MGAQQVNENTAHALEFLVRSVYTHRSGERMKKPAELLSTSEVAERLKISKQHARALITEGKLPATKVGRDWVVNSDDLKLVANRPKRGRPRKKAKDDDDE
jgi:excisionase family DNA binding protein